MTTLNWTKVNFTVHELTHMVSRIDLQNEIIHSKLKDTGIRFPRNEKKMNKNHFSPLPSNEEIMNCMIEAKTCAIIEAKSFGMSVEENEISFCDLPAVDVKNVDNLMDDDDFFPNEPIFQESSNDEQNDDLCDMLIDKLSIQDKSEMKPKIDESSRFTQVTGSDGSMKTVPKSFVVWMLSDSKEKMSNDRLQRVRNKSACQATTFQRVQSAPDLSTLGDSHIVSISNEISLGKWCIFKKSSKRCANNFNNCILGAILCFQYKEGKNQKQKQYTLDSVSVGSENVQTLATWYRVDSKGALIPCDSENSFFIDINCYIATIDNPDFENGEIFLSGPAALHIKHFLSELNKKN